MRINELITEMKKGKISKRQQQSTRGLNTYKDGERADSTYTSYRLGMAVAGANGKDPIEMNGKSWAGKTKTTHPYSKEEQEIYNNLLDLNSPDPKSQSAIDKMPEEKRKRYNDATVKEFEGMKKKKVMEYIRITDLPAG